jgi:hypothetical protein
MRLRVTNPNVIHETIDEVAILLDLKTGTYYSLRGTGAAIWQSIQEGAGVEEIEADLRHRYEASDGEIHNAVQELVAELEREGLVRAEEGDTEHKPGPSASTNAEARLPFEAPMLEKHTDMKEVILLDPVHQVGAEGWPYPAEPEDSDA